MVKPNTLFKTSINTKKTLSTYPIRMCSHTLSTPVLLSEAKKLNKQLTDTATYQNQSHGNQSSASGNTPSFGGRQINNQYEN